MIPVTTPVAKPTVIDPVLLAGLVCSERFGPVPECVAKERKLEIGIVSGSPIYWEIERMPL
jgi:hypothetical protein